MGVAPDPDHRDSHQPADDCGARTLSFRQDQPRLMSGRGFSWEHEIRVAVPSTYEDSERDYPVLWLTDNLLEEALVALPAAELILVSVGSPHKIGAPEITKRRTYDFQPGPHLHYGGPLGNALQQELVGSFPELAQPGATGGAHDFLAFLVDEVRPALAANYRMSDDHCLFGFSQGGAFLIYTLFTRPSAFGRYICGSGTLYGGDDVFFQLEERYAARHDDLPVRLFLGAGDAEMSQPLIAAFGCVSSTIKMAELLTIRRYPSLDLDLKVFTGESHETVRPRVLAWGVRSVWSDALIFSQQS